MRLNVIADAVHTTTPRFRDSGPMARQAAVSLMLLPSSVCRNAPGGESNIVDDRGSDDARETIRRWRRDTRVRNPEPDQRKPDPQKARAA